jgi:sugar lactone lactonase YvrE
LAVAADSAVSVVKSFDASLGQLPEGIAIDKVGNIYVGLGPPCFVGCPYGAIWRLSPDGTETMLVEYPNGPSPAGLAVAPNGTLYYALGGDESMRGVYRLAPGGTPERLPGTENIILANGLALDKQGALYVSDSILGAVWRVVPGARAAAQIWIQDPLLAGCDPANAIGANGVAFWRNELYIASTVRGLLVSVPVQPDGTAGAPTIVAGTNECDPAFDELDAIDGIALDVHGNVYAMLVIQNKLVRIDPSNGASTVLLTGEDGLHNGASITFGTGKGDRESVFMTNFAVLPPVPPNSFGPAVLQYDVGVPGLPLP